METHIKIIGVLHIVMGALGMLAALCFLLFFGGLGFLGAHIGQSDDWVAIPVLGSIGGILFMIIAVLALPSLITGIGLLGLLPWARIFGIILSALHLFNVPFGTALGVYGLWALLSPEGEALFRRPVAYVPQTY